MFADEENHYARGFDLGWGARAESALEIAGRVQDLCAKLAGIEPAQREVWPLFAARNPQRGRDPGPILELSVEEFGEVIDRRARFDPPRYPAPVDETGYSLAMQCRPAMDPLYVGMNLRAGDRRTPEPHIGNWNELKIDFHLENRIWRNRSVALDLLQACVSIFEPTWLCVYGHLSCVDLEESRVRPWMIWTRPETQPPAWYTRNATPAEETADAFGGALRIWP